MKTIDDLRIPSGSEVEADTLHPRSGLRSKLDALKVRGFSRAYDIRRAASDRSSRVRDDAKARVTKVTDSMADSMRTSPGKWAGVAAGSGLVLGLIGRIAQARSRRRRAIPTLVIVETGR